MNKGIIYILLAVAIAVCFSPVQSVYAANASRMIGFSARDEAMAGATTASTEDTSCLVKNPAGLVRIGNRIDASYENILLHDVTLRPQGRPIPLAPIFNFTNADMIEQSNINYLPGGNAGVSYRIPGTDKYPISVGIGAFTIGGMALNYPSPRLNTAVLNPTGNNNYDKMLDLRSMRIAPGIAVGFTDKLSFGATANIELQGLRTNLAEVPGLTETGGAGDWDFAPGAGFTVGLLYQFNDMLNLGASYESHGWMGDHYKYKAVLPYIDEPPIVNFGIAFKPIKNWEFTYDTRYINWTDVKLARNAPKDGGFGWTDQWVFATGSEYTTFKDKLKLRLGYMYGKSPIQPNVIFTNALMPLILEHHLTTGFSYLLTKNLSLDFAWEHHFFNAMTDNGGDSADAIGTGTKVTAAVDILAAGLSYKF